MASVINSPNMNLPVPVVSVDFGPDWANNLNACLSTIDGHNHAAGSGIQINPSGININADLPFNGNNAISLRSSRYNTVSAPLALATDLACSYSAGTAGDLYWNDLNGNKIQITASGGVAGSQGSIAGLSAPASATYVSATGTFVWKSASTVAANMDFATGIFRYNGSYPSPSGSNWIAIEVPSSIATGYALTLPAAPPASTSIVQMDSSGNLSAVLVVDNSTIKISSNTLEVATGGITGTQVATNINLPGKAVQETGLNVVVSNSNAAQSLAIVRVQFNSSGVVIGGEGATASAAGSGVYNLAWSAGFNDVPVVSLTSTETSKVPWLFNPSTGGCTVNITNLSGSGLNGGFTVVAIGQRA